MKRIYYIYKLEAPNGKVYIGQTISLNKRFSSYRNLGCSRQKFIYNVIKKYGWENIKKSILFDGYKSQIEIDLLEREYINFYTDLGVSLNLLKDFNYPEYKTGISNLFSKPVLKISLDFKILKEYVSGTEAGKEIGVSQSCISLSCRSENPFCMGFYWRFKDGFDIEALKKITEKPNSRNKKVVQLDNKNNLIKVWESQTQASEELGINQANIWRVMSGKGLSAGGFRWAYEKDFNIDKMPDYELIKRGKKISVFKLTGELIKTFDSVAYASKVLNVDRVSILRQIQGKVKKPKKYLYEYV